MENNTSRSDRLTTRFKIKVNFIKYHQNLSRFYCRWLFVVSIIVFLFIDEVEIGFYTYICGLVTLIILRLLVLRRYPIKAFNKNNPLSWDSIFSHLKEISIFGVTLLLLIPITYHTQTNQSLEKIVFLPLMFIEGYFLGKGIIFILKLLFSLASKYAIDMRKNEIIYNSVLVSVLFFGYIGFYWYLSIYGTIHSLTLYTLFQINYLIYIIMPVSLINIIAIIVKRRNSKV